MANKKLLILALAFGMTVICCDLTGGGQEPVYLSLHKWDGGDDAVGTVEIRFRTNKLDIDALTLTDSDLFNDFKVTIDGSPKSVTGLGIIYGTYLNIGIEGTYAMRLPALKAKLDPQFCSWQICFKFWEKLDCT